MCAKGEHTSPASSLSPKDRKIPVAYVVIEVRKRNKGMPLLPQIGHDGKIDWVPPDRRITLCEYLAQCLAVLTNKPWSDRIFAVLPGHPLPVYQAAINVEDCMEIFDALLKPFAEQRTAYRVHYSSKNAPELDFGAEPRSVDPVFVDEVERGMAAGHERRAPPTAWASHTGAPLHVKAGADSDDENAEPGPCLGASMPGSPASRAGSFFGSMCSDDALEMHQRARTVNLLHPSPAQLQDSPRSETWDSPWDGNHIPVKNNFVHFDVATQGRGRGGLNRQKTF